MLKYSYGDKGNPVKEGTLQSISSLTVVRTRFIILGDPISQDKQKTDGELPGKWTSGEVKTPAIFRANRMKKNIRASKRERERKNLGKSPSSFFTRLRRRLFLSDLRPLQYSFPHVRLVLLKRFLVLPRGIDYKYMCVRVRACSLAAKESP